VVVLAVAHRQKGDKNEVRRWYDKSVNWTEKNDSNSYDLRRLQDEAADLVGIPVQHMPNGPDAFGKLDVEGAAVRSGEPPRSRK
jgi:hypothetical protein